MAQTVRCKFRCTSVEKDAPYAGATEVKLWADYDPEIPEDQRYATATPAGEMRFVITNPAVEGFFKPDKCYYFDAVEAE